MEKQRRYLQTSPRRKSLKQSPPRRLQMNRRQSPLRRQQQNQRQILQRRQQRRRRQYLQRNPQRPQRQHLQRNPQRPQRQHLPQSQQRCQRRNPRRLRQPDLLQRLSLNRQEIRMQIKARTATSQTLGKTGSMAVIRQNLRRQPRQRRNIPYPRNRTRTREIPVRQG